MTVKEIAKSVNKTERSVRNWIKKLSEKSSVIKEKSSVSSPMNPADYDIDEVVMIIEVGLGKNAAMIYKQNASDKTAVATLESKPDDSLMIISNMMEQNQKFMIAVLDKLDKIGKGQQSLPAPQIEQDYFSLTAYCAVKNIKLNHSEALMHGRYLKKLAKEKDSVLRKIPDERWGFVNSYPIELLNEYFSL